MNIDYIQQPQITPDPIHDKPPHKHKYLSSLLMILSCVTWVCGYIYSNQHNINPIETSMLRGLTITLISYLIVRYEGHNIHVLDKEDSRGILIRNAIFLMQGYLLAYVQFYLPLGITHTLAATGSIFVSVWQYLLQGRKLDRKEIGGMAFTCFGVLLTANGRLIQEWIWNQEFESGFENYHSKDAKTVALWSLLLLFFFVFWGYSVYRTNKIRQSAHTINTHFGIKLALISFLLYPLTQSPNSSFPPASPSVFYWGFLYTGVLFAMAESFFVMSIMMSSNIGITIMLGTSTIVIAYVVSIMRYGEKINGFCVVGSACVIGGLGWIVL